MLKRFIFGLFLLAAAAACGQQPPVLIVVSSAPSGTCTVNSQAQYIPATNVTYTCPSGTWTALGSQTSLPYTPLARYQMNQTSGPPTDSSGNGYNCTSTGGTVTWAANGTRVYGNGYDNCPSAAVSGAKTVSVTYSPTWNLMHASTTANASYAAVWGIDSNYNLNLPMWMSNGGVTFNSISTIEVGTADKYQGYVTVTVVLGSGSNACSMYINGQPIKSLAYQAGCPASLSSSSELYLGTVGGIPNGAYVNMAQFTSYTQALTPAQVLQDYQANVQSIYTPQGLQVGFDPTDYSKPCVIYIGDSKWSNTLNNYNFATAEPSYVDALLGPAYNTWNISINGELLSAMYTNYAATVQPILSQCTSKTNVVVIEGGVNDIHGGTSAAALYTIVQNFTTAIHNSGAYAVFQTLTPSGWLTSGNGLLAVETAYNSDLVGYASLDALDRADLNPIMGSQAAIASSIYYNNSDGSETHWSPLGAQILAYGTAEAIASVLNGGQSVRTVKVPLTYLVMNAAATTMTIPLVALGPRQQILGGAVRVGSYSTGAGGSATTFTGTSITDLTCTLGDSSGSATSYISTAMNLMANSRYLFANTSFFSLSGQPELVCTATGGNFSALTAGTLDVSLTVATQ